MFAVISPERAALLSVISSFIEFPLGLHGCCVCMLIRAALAGACGSFSASHACNCATTAAPSPTAAATRFVELARASPIANTPGTEVVERQGCRSPCDRAVLLTYSLAEQVNSSTHESLVVDLDAAPFEPSGVGIGTNKEKYATNGLASSIPVARFRQRTPLHRRRCPELQ